MPSLKDLRTRINSVKSTRKITQAMKMVAAAKLRRAQSQAEAARPYAERMERMLATLGAAVTESSGLPVLLTGTGRDEVHLLVVITADRGLCGPFNTNVCRFARTRIRALEAEGKTVKLIMVGRKGATFLRREFGSRYVAEITLQGRKRLGFEDADRLAETLREMLAAGEFDVCALVTNRFRSVIAQIPTEQRLIPVPIPETAEAPDPLRPPQEVEYEPDEQAILAALLPRNLSVQIYRALLESAAGEQGARMTAMDNATRNAGEMIKKLTLNYNRTRQANITKELIEIISGAEAV